MMKFTELAPVPCDPLVPFTDQLQLAVAAYLARFKGASREHTESDLRCFLAWCAERSLDPLAARRPHLALHIRWMQEIRRFQPSTVSRRISVAAGFYRTCVGRSTGQAIGSRTGGPILLNTRGSRMDRHAATRRLRRVAETAGVQTAKAHPHMLRHTAER